MSRKAKMPEPVSPFGGKHIVRLGERQKGYLQVLLPEFVLTKTGQGRLLEVSVHDNLMSITGPDGKREFNAAVAGPDDARALLAAKLDKFEDDDRVLSYRFDCAAAPLRYANGGVLPVVRIDGRDHFCLFYRDIFPIGWNIANGGSDNLEEMLDPQRIVFREFGEELFIFDHREELFYAFDPGDEELPADYQTEALVALRDKSRRTRLLDYQRLPVPLKWVEGPDEIRTNIRGRTLQTGGYFLNITTEDCGIELDRIAIINLKGDVVFFDGEFSHGTLFNQVVGLFAVERLAEGLDENRFIPDRIFFCARERNPRQLQSIIENEYQPPIESRRTPGERAEYEKFLDRYNLCPVTRNIAKRYLDWVRTAPSEPGTGVEVRKLLYDAAKTEVFVSFRSEAEPIARRLVEYLRGRKHKVFFSADSLKMIGESDYCQAIDAALESARCMVVVGCEPEHFSSGWVGYEWRSFLNEIHSRRKKGGQLFTFVSGLEVAELPFALRSQQMIPYSDTAPQDSVEELYSYVKPTLTRRGS